MLPVRLIHWNAAEAEERTRQLRNAGYTVDASPFDGPASLRTLRASPPAAVVIDLGRLPSQGRDLGLALRVSATTRLVPLIFVDGTRDKVARVREALPDAVYTSWEEIGPALVQALARPPEAVRVPTSALAGYSGTPLPKKLDIRAGSVVVLAGAPAGFEETLGPLPEDVRLVRRNRGRRDLTIWFVRSRAELERGVEAMTEHAGGGGLWIAWPKKAGGIASDLAEGFVRQAGLDAGLVDFKVCAIDAAWSGLRFSRRRELR
jgi:hypothetical protein